MCTLFAGLALLNIRLIVLAAHSGQKASVFFSLLFLLFTAAAIAGQIWFQRRIVAEFRYDGATLEFLTVAGQGQPAQFRPLAHIVSIRDWRGRGGNLGYLLQFQDRQKLYLEYSVTNSIALVNRLREDLTG